MIKPAKIEAVNDSSAYLLREHTGTTGLEQTAHTAAELQAEK